MVTKMVFCRHCRSENIIRHGYTASGKQRYLCWECHRRSCDDPKPNGYTAEQRELILRAYQESSLRELQRTFGVSRNTVTAWLKRSGRRSLP